MQHDHEQMLSHQSFLPERERRASDESDDPIKRLIEANEEWDRERERSESRTVPLDDQRLSETHWRPLRDERDSSYNSDSFTSAKDPLLHEKYESIYSATKPVKRSLFSLLSRSCASPLTVILGQSIILAFAWFIFSFVFIRQVVPLPFSLALKIQAEPHVMTLIVTLIATVISLISSFLFSLSVRYAINFYLFHRSLKIYMFGVTTKIKNGGVVFDWNHLGSTFLSLILALLLHTQTASWSTLLTPVPIVLESDIYARETDITNNTFFNLYKSAPRAIPFVSEQFTLLGGLTAVTATFGNTTTSFNVPSQNGTGPTWTFINTTGTGGIFPLVAENIDDSLDHLMSIPIDIITPLSLDHPFPEGFSSSYAMHNHQGITIDVSCTEPVLDVSDSSPLVNTSIGRTQIQYGTANAPSSEMLTSYQFLMKCGNTTQNTDFIYAFNSASTVLSGLACPEEVDDSGEGSYAFIVYAVRPSAYLADFQRDLQERAPPLIIGGLGPVVSPWTMVCTITPKLGSIAATYNDTLINPSVLSSETISNNSLVAYAVTALQQLFTDSQQLESNTIGDSLSTLLGDVSSSIPDIFAAFIKGCIEYSVTISRPSTNVLIENIDDPPPWTAVVPPVRLVNGTHYASTIGFSRQPAYTLVPINLVGLSSILLLVFIALSKPRNTADETPKVENAENLNAKFARESYILGATFKPADELKGEERDLDAGDPLHLLDIASAGGLVDVFEDGIGVLETKTKEDIPLRMGKVGHEAGNGRIGLVHYE